MKRLLLSAAIIALSAPAAFAADLPVYEPAPMVAPNPVSFDWSGVYIGAHGGYGWADLDTNDDSDDFNFDDADLEGFVVGGQLGYNWQVNQFVFGVEVDGSFSDIGIDDGDFFDEDDDDDDDEIGYDWLASARGRLGFGFDRFLVYGTGGVGFGGFNSDIAFADDDDDDDDEAQIGWVAGGGVEFMITQNVSIGAEYLHYDFSDVLDNDNFDGDLDSTVDVARGRVNIKFNSLFGG